MTKMQCPENNSSLWEYQYHKHFPLKNPLCVWMGISRNRFTNDTRRQAEIWWGDTGTHRGEIRKVMK